MFVEKRINGFPESLPTEEEQLAGQVMPKVLNRLNLTCMLLVMMFFGLSIQGFSQVKAIGIPSIQNHTKWDYGAGNQNWAISQDQNGFMYFANNDGVLRYDGIHWDLIKVSSPSPVRSVFVDKENDIYVGLYNDFGVLAKDEAGQLFFQSLRNLVPEGIQDFDNIWKIHQLSEGIAFQSFDYLFILQDDTLNVIKPEQRFHFSFSVGGRLFLNEPAGGMFELENGALKKVPWANPLRDNEIWGIMQLNEGSLLIGTNKNGLYKYKNGILEKWEVPVSQLVEKYQLFSMIPIQDNYLAFGTILNGLIISNEEGEVIQHININDGLQNNTVLSLYLDSHQNLWLGLDNGIDYIEINSPLSYYSMDGKMGTGYACRVFQGKLYLGTNQGLYVKSFDSVSPANEDFQLVDNTVGQVWSLHEAEGQLLCGHNAGSFQINGNRAVKISDGAGVWKFIPFKGAPGLLLGGNYNGLFTLKKSGRSWKPDKQIKGFNESSRYLAQGADGEIWVSHGAKGVFRIELNAPLDSVLEYKLYTSADGLPSDEQNILIQFEGRPYVSTIDGIYQYEKKADRFIPTNELKRFSLSGQLKTLVTDEQGDVWFISDNESGVFRLNEDLTYTKISLPFKSLNESYVRGFEFVYPYNGEHAFFGIDNGFAHYSSGFLKSYTQPLQAFITKVEMPYLDSALYNQTPTTDLNYKFPHNKNAFRFHYTAPFYEKQDWTEFSYLLENYDDEWSSWSNINYKDFTNLPQGNYTFKVKARNIYDVESNIASFGFKIMPPWYKTSEARFVYAFMVIGLILLTMKIIIYRMEMSKQRVIQQHTTELSLKEEKYQLEKLMTEKEIIRLRNEKLQNEMVFRDKELANQTMGIIHKNKFLVNLKAELQRVQKSVTEEKVRKKLVGITRNINKEIDNKQQNQIFETYFDEVHAEFFERLKKEFADLSPREMRLCAYIRMNLTSKEIAALLNISDRGVEISRYRLRKKLGLSRDINLSTYLSNL